MQPKIPASWANLLFLDLVCAFLNFVWGLSLTILPILAFQLGSAYAQIALIATVFSLVNGLSQPLWGVVSDRLGKRKVFIVLGFAVSGLMFVVVGFARTVNEIILARAGVGLCVAAVVPMALAMTADLSSPERYGRNIGALNASNSIGFALGLGLSGALAELLGIHATIILCAALSLTAAALSMLLTEPSASTEPEERPTYDSSPAISPLGDLKHISSAALIPLYSVAFTYIFGEALIGVFFPLFLLQMGISKSAVGFLLFLRSAVTTLLTIPFGSLSDRYGRKRFISSGVFIYGIGYLTFRFSSSFWGIVAAQILTGVGAAAFVAGGNALVADVTQPANRAVAMGLFNASTNLAYAIGPIVGGNLADRYGLFSALTLVPAVQGVASILSLLFLKETLPSKSRR